jgi:RNA polymerase sigma factor (sigma-70 family)
MTALAEAERLLQEQYEPLKAETLRSLQGKLRASGVTGLDDELDAYYNQAWHALYEQVAAGVEIANVGGFLVQVAYRRAIDDLRRLRPGDRADLEEADALSADADVADRLDEQRMLRELSEALRAELDERERVAASLCYVHGYTRPEAARLMGIGERRMQKLMDRVSKVVNRVTGEIRSGGRCDMRESLIKAYALGLLDEDGERYAMAREHLRECARCRADVLRMRGLAIVAPAPLLPWAALQLAGGAAAGGGGAAAAMRPRGHSVSTLVAGGAAATAAVVAAVAIAVAVLPDDDQTSPVPAATPPASASSASAPERRAQTPPRRRHRRARPQAAASAAAGTAAAAPSAAAQPAASDPPASAPAEPSAPAGPAEPAATTPAPSAPASTTPAPAPPPTAPAEPAAGEQPVLDDGSQEFGLEP